MADEKRKQIKEIFNAALRQKAEDRPKFLDDACRNDADLRREVESLLSSYEDAASFMEKPAAAQVADEIAGGKIFESGIRFGHYEIVRQIGAGGMGVVYLAKDTKLDRHVAVKILNEKYSRQKSNLSRFIREAKSASALNHPNILVIHEIGEAENSHYIVSEYISGKTLREILNEKTLQTSEVLGIAIQIAGAVAAAHEAHLVHRDIKPENIMIRPDGYAKILDFGLAKLVGQKAFDMEDSTVKQGLTTKGVILGTVNYMSPEQAKGERVDERTDIFSFGVVIYEMLAGRTPFQGDSVSETFANLINKEPHPLARFAGGVPDDLERIVAKTLRKRTGERYRTMLELLADLKNLQKRIEFESEFKGKISFETDDETRELKAGKTNFPPQNSIAVLPFANISADAENEYFCEGLAEELLNALSRIEDLKVAARTSAFSFKGKNTEISEIGKALNVGKILEGSVRKYADRVRINIQLVNAENGFQIWSERFDGEMRDIFDLQDKIALAVIDKLKVKFLSEEKSVVLKRYTDNPEAYSLFLNGRFHWYKMLPKSILKSREYFQQAIELDPSYAPGYAGLGEFYGLSAALGLMPPDEAWPKAEAAIMRALDLDDTLPEAHNGLAAIKMMFYRDWTSAHRELERAIELNPNFAEVHNLYSFCLAALGRLDEAAAHSRRSIQLDPLSATYQRYLGNWLYFSRRFDESAAEFRKSLELDPYGAPVYEEFGYVCEHRKMYDEAAAAYHQALSLDGGENVAAEFDRIYAEQGFDAAVRTAARIRLEQLEEVKKAGHYVPAIALARVHLRLGNRETALDWLEKAAEERNVFLLFMNHDPFYDSLRDDPRFIELVRRVNI